MAGLILRVSHQHGHLGRPLTKFWNLPGPDPALTPDQMRGLAAALLALADECEAVQDACRRRGPHASVAVAWAE